MIRRQDDAVFDEITARTRQLSEDAERALAASDRAQANPNLSYPIDQTADHFYDIEDAIHKARMLAADIRVNLDGKIDDATLSKRAKDALHVVTAELFDQNVVLALNDNIELRKLKAEEALNIVKLACSKPDVMNPMFVIITEAINQSFGDFVSRSFRGTERFEQGKRTTVTDQKITHKIDGGQQDRGFIKIPGIGGR